MIEAFHWNRYFETGVAIIDAQHQRLVGLLNELAGNVESAMPAHIDAALAALTEYTVYHFQSEEGLMTGENVTGEHREHHRRAHQNFIAQVQSWLAMRDAAGQLSLQEMLNYLSNWLVFHILGEDQELSRQLRVAEASPGTAPGEDPRSADPRTDILLHSLERLYESLLARNQALLGSNAQLDAAHAALAQANADLERRVALRTAELSASNLRLQEEQARRMQTERLAAVGQLAAGFAHEINTPVGIAVGAVSQADQTVSEILAMLSREEVSEADLRAALDMLQESSRLALSNLQRAARLTGGFKRASIDQVSEQPHVFVFGEMIQDTLFTLHGKLKHLPIRIEVDCPADLRLEGVPGLYEQVLTNLILNSVIHAYGEGSRAGTIRIEVTRLDDDRLRLVFADDGMGMAEEIAAHAFEPFNTTRRNQGGTGLGLYVCHDIVTHRLQGKIDCDSAPGRGTRFRIEVSLHHPPERPNRQ